MKIKRGKGGYGQEGEEETSCERKAVRRKILKETERNLENVTEQIDEKVK